MSTTKKRKRLVAKYKKPTVDPAVREAADIISRMSAREVAERSWVSPGTFYRIKNGKTSRPHNLTVEGLLRAAGFSRIVVRSNEPPAAMHVRSAGRSKKPKVKYV